MLRENVNIIAKPHEVRKIMKDTLGMSYRKIKFMSIHTNSEKNLVLRQRFAIEFLELMKKGKRIINIDETWLGQTDFRKMKWRVKGTTNPVGMVQMVPRISMIVGLDTDGKVYLSLLQSNSNAKVMDIFFRQLSLKLDKERANWRKDTIILLDNVPYHTCTTTVNLLKGLGFTVLYTGPHSYDASPSELLIS